MSETRQVLSKRDYDNLETIDWGERCFGSLITNRQFPVATMLQLVDRGLVAAIGMVAVCDDDGGHLVPERYATGYVLTSAGRAAMLARRAELDAELDRLTPAGAP